MSRRLPAAPEPATYKRSRGAKADEIALPRPCRSQGWLEGQMRTIGLWDLVLLRVAVLAMATARYLG